jgi:hypothetical protein
MSSLLLPTALSVLVLSPLLILAYLNRSPRKHRFVSSLLLYRDLPRLPAIRDKIKLPWRFFLELLILLLLAVLAAYPVYETKGQRVALLLDNSLSMSALSSQGGLRRYDSAKEQLEKWLNLQSDKDRFTLFLSSPSLIKTSKDLVSRGEISSLLPTLLPASSAPDYIESSLTELTGSGQFDKVFVVSDKEPNYAAKTEFPIEVRVVGESVQNLALINLRLDRRGGGVVASLLSFTAQPAQARLRATAGSTLIAESTVTLEPKRVTEAILPLKSVEGEIVRIDLVPFDLSQDAIALDNIGYIDLQKRNLKNLLVVSDANPGESILGLAPFGAEGVSGDGYAKLQSEEVERYNAVVFHQLVPRNLPRVPTLIISPPRDNSTVRVLAELENPVVSSWRTESNLTSYLNLSLLKLGRAQSFELPAWAQSVVSVEQGSVILAGEESGVRRVAVGFELLPFEGKRTATVSVLTLNILNWLAGGAQFEDTLRTGAVLPLPKEGKWLILFPGGRTQEGAVAGGKVRADVSGLYRIRDGEKESRIVVNAFHPEESATDEKSTFEVNYSGEATQPSDNLFWIDLTKVLLALLLIDLSIRLIILLRGKDAQ